jgi:hypothetical protein
MDEVSQGRCAEFDSDDPADCAGAIHRAIKSSPEQLRSAEERSATFSWDKSAEALVSAWRTAAEKKASD